MSGIMHILITTLHVLACIALMVAILLQSGRGGGLAGAFGAGSSQTLFGGRGAATFLSRAATTLAVVFFLTSLTLGLASSRTGAGTSRSLIQEEARKRAGQRGQESAPPMGGGMTPGQGMTSPAPGPAPAPSQTPPATAPAPTTQPKAPATQPSKTSTSGATQQTPSTTPSSGTTQQAPAPTSPSGATEPGTQPSGTQQAPSDQQQTAPSGSTTP